MNNYIEIKFENIDPEKQESLVALLTGVDYEGFEQTHDSLSAFIPEENFDETALEEITGQFQVSFSQQTIPEQNWNAIWETGFEPVQVDTFASIRAAFHESVAGITHDIIITPRMSFGTGHHATTEMMIRQMEQIAFTGKTVFDFGTGTGVLAILAEKCGAEKIVAIDNDQWSIVNATDNIMENGCTRIELQKADGPPAGLQFDIILANINRNIILENIPALVEGLTRDGTLLLSGLLEDDEEALLDCTIKYALRPLNRLVTGPWLCMRFGR